MAESSPQPVRLSSLFGNVELIVVILLGIVSVATAYTGFQGALYGGASDDRISKSQVAQTEAESLYLEGNQQYVQDSATVLNLSELNIEKQSADPIVAADAAAKYDEVYFIGVSPELDTAIQNAAALDESDSDFYHDPQADEDYQAALFTDYADKSDESAKLRTEGDNLGDQGDQLGFYTALMAITLFLLGVAAVVRKARMQWVLIAVGMSIFTLTAVLTALIPFVWIGF